MDTKKPVLIMATNNEHKLREIRQILADCYEVKGLSDIGCHEDIPETSDTLEGNALQKARYVHEHYGTDCFADDTGLEVEALDGAPGVFTARFGQMNGYGESHDSDANIRCLLDKLRDTDNRRARFRTVIALVRNGEEHQFEGIVEGEILREKTGTDGFGYDPIFAPVEAGVSFAEMGPQEKNRISHRGRATQKLAAFLRMCMLFLLLILHPSPFTLLCAQTIGEWRLYPSYRIAQKNVAVNTSVYTLTISQQQIYNDIKENYNLMRYDSEDTSVHTYSALDALNDRQILHMAYSEEAKRLLLVYENGNIDLLDQNDKVLNIASLKESNLSNKEVKNVYVDGHNAYLATGFGFLTVDMQEGVIRDTYRLGVDVQAIAARDGVVYIGTNSGLYYSTEENMHLMANWKQQSGVSNAYTQMFVFDRKVYAVQYGKLFRVNDGAQGLTQLATGVKYASLAGGQLIYITDSEACIYQSDTQVQHIALPGQWLSLSYANGTYWACEGAEGLKGYKLSGDAFVETVGSIRPNSPVRDLSYRMQYVGDRLLVAGGINTPYAIYYPETAMYLEDGEWTNLDEEGVWEQYPDLRHRNMTHLVQDPTDPTHHYASGYRSGLYEYRNGKFVALHNSDNSPLQQIVLDGRALGLNFVGCTGLQYDGDGNLWMMNQQTDTIVRILQPSGRWLSLYYDDINGIETPEDFLFTTSGVNFLVSRRMDGRGFFAFHTNGTLNSVRDDKYMLRSRIVNQDGTSYAPDEFYCMAEDLGGRIWCGTQLGLFVINDATTFFDSDFAFEQIKIARDDGSNLADYLLSGVAVTCIAVDGANRKWIGTRSNGLYLVSADGLELIHHFQADDSPLPSDNIQCLAIHPTTGLVMIGTDAGLCSYVSDATEAEEELRGDDVVAYPNPVRPDYRGPIAVRGLTMDGEVKICTTTGQLVWSGTSNGGTFTWDGTNKRGKRVASGVYHVIANTSDGKKAVVSRIIVVK
ncbi:MAG: RdgB/HAM1 family non-canonical purine NTP pyrophosphatase [Bacteroidaceae bacterium]|nr:RdgB/HAM1 family non-canonical purine NTP pyrophosphatase [Bacteroidaceae bacterium]